MGWVDVWVSVCSETVEAGILGKTRHLQEENSTQKAPRRKPSIWFLCYLTSSSHSFHEDMIPPGQPCLPFPQQDFLFLDFFFN